MSELLPCLNSPTTHTMVEGRRSRPDPGHLGRGADHSPAAGLDRGTVDWTVLDASGPPEATLAAARRVLGL